MYCGNVNHITLMYMYMYICICPVLYYIMILLSIVIAFFIMHIVSYQFISCYFRSLIKDAPFPPRPPLSSSQ